MEVELEEGDKKGVLNAQRARNESIDNVKLSDAVVRKHVMNYLLHNFYEQTASAFMREQVQRHEMQLKHTLPSVMKELRQRRNMTEKLRQGKVLDSIEQANLLIQNSRQTTIQKQYPMLYTRLLCQHFTELIRDKQTVRALNFAQTDIVPMGKRHEEAMKLLRRYFALLAYKQPELSPLFELVDVRQREVLAEELNGRVCRLTRSEADLNDVHSDLERVLRQLTLVMRRVGGEKKEKDDWCVAHVFEEVKNRDSEARNGDG